MTHSTNLSFDLLKRDGFVMFRDTLDLALVDRARQELEVWFDRDLEERRGKGVPLGEYRGAHGRSILDVATHILVDVFGKSPALDLLFEQMLLNETASDAIRCFAGTNRKLRGYNARRMTGERSTSSMEWHRDSPGEFGWSLGLTDTPTDDDGATAFLPGSHFFPYCPRKETLFAPPRYEGFHLFRRFNLCSRMLHRRVMTRASGGKGKRGDYAVFINDIWHGRQPNWNGRNTMVVLIGGFPTEFPFPDRVDIPADSVLKALPPGLREFTDFRGRPDNSDQNAFVYEMLQKREKVAILSLWWWAQLERKWFYWIWAPMAALRTRVRRLSRS